MPIYTLCSTDVGNYGEILVSIPFYNTERVCDVTVLSACTMYNIELLNENDYIDISVGGSTHRLIAIPIVRSGQEELITYLQNRLEASGLPDMKAVITSINTIDFVYNQEFSILNMSYNFKIITGFYYLNDKNNFPIKAIQLDENEWILSIKACPFYSSTPVLYLLSNTGGNCYRMNLDQETLQTGTIAMIIHNSFQSGLPAIFQQADITTRVYSSDLTYMRITLCDCNLRPIKLLNPLFVTLSINEIVENFAVAP
jgi:hypothetical protein